MENFFITELVQVNKVLKYLLLVKTMLVITLEPNLFSKILF
jgi:hypothetical protein